MSKHGEREPSAAEIAFHEARGERLIQVDGQWRWVYGVTFTPRGGAPIELPLVRHTGGDEPQGSQQ